MTIKHWPHKERPREKLLAHGAENLSDAELLAIFLNSGTCGLSAIDIARQLLKSSGGLRAITKMSKKDLCSNKGVGDVCYARLHAGLEITRRTLMESMKKKDTVASPERARKYLTLKMRNYPHEVFACLFLDNQHRVIAFEELFRGTIDGASVHPREVVKRTLHHNAAAIILVHNHPSGGSEPSHADRHITEELKSALALIDVRILDHFVVGEKITSFTESNLL